MRQIKRSSLAVVLCLTALCPAGLVTAQPLSFTDATSRARVATNGVARGVAVADYDGDGWDDVYVSVVDGVSSLFRNDHDGTFTDVGAAAGVAVQGRYSVALWGDVNNDGRLDLFVGQRWRGVNRLFLQNDDGTFRDEASISGIDRRARVETAAFGDFDGDGKLDLFLATLASPDLLYRSASEESDAFFVDITEEAGVAGLSSSTAMQATWVDFDRDGDLDLFAVHDGYSVESRLYRNDGRLPMLDVAPEANIASVGAGNSMGIAWGDVDGDGWPDAYVTRVDTGGLYRNNGNGTFRDIAVESGSARNGWGWGVVFADFDHDGDQDLFIASEHGTPSRLFRNEGGSFTEISEEAGAALAIDAFGAASGDFNNDGYTDLFVANQDGRNKVLMNDGRSSGNWVKVALDGRTVNRMAIGTRVEVTAGGRTYARVVEGGDSYCSQSSPTLHFGLGTAPRIDTLRIYWSRSSVDERSDLEVNTTHGFVEGELETRGASFRRGDCDADGHVGGMSDAVLLLHFNFSGGAEPPCLAACDANLDGEVIGSVTDALYLLQFAFLGGPAPFPPFPGCGPGTATDQELGCAEDGPSCR